MDYRPLRMGDTGPEVLEVQGMLSALGYAVAQADGNFDTSTLRAVIGFQSDRSLPVDGVVAVNTWTALKKHASPPETPQESGGDDMSGCERERPPRKEEPALLVPLEAPSPHMPPMPPQERQVVTQEPPSAPGALPDLPRAFAVPTVPLLVWKPIREESALRVDSPSPEPVMPVEEPIVQPRGWTPVQV